MKIIKDITMGMKWNYALLELLKPRRWANELKYRKQRMDRGWSDKDAWAGGEYIMEAASGILKHLHQDKIHYGDKPGDYFKLNFKSDTYDSLLDVAKDIDDYLEFERLDGNYSLKRPFLQVGAENAMIFVSKNIGKLWN